MNGQEAKRRNGVWAAHLIVALVAVALMFASAVPHPGVAHAAGGEQTATVESVANATPAPASSSVELAVQAVGFGHEMGGCAAGEHHDDLPGSPDATDAHAGCHLSPTCAAATLAASPAMPSASRRAGARTPMSGARMTGMRPNPEFKPPIA